MVTVCSFVQNYKDIYIFFYFQKTQLRVLTKRNQKMKKQNKNRKRRGQYLIYQQTIKTQQPMGTLRKKQHRNRVIINGLQSHVTVMIVVLVLVLVTRKTRILINFDINHEFIYYSILTVNNPIETCDTILFLYVTWTAR